MEDMLEEHRFDFEFIEAVDGRKIEDAEALFGVKSCERRYARRILPGEIGCTLSHQICYKRIIKEDLQGALILEDDVRFIENIERIIYSLEDILNSNIPLVILLSGRYWYKGTKKKLEDGYTLKEVFDAFLTQAYLINNYGARLLLEDKPDFKADDWYEFKKRGLKIYAVNPHVVEENSGKLFLSTIAEENAMLKGYIGRKTFIYFRELVKRMYRLVGHFEKEGGHNRDNY